jgi:hypothetical protein
MLVNEVHAEKRVSGAGVLSYPDARSFCGRARGAHEYYDGDQINEAALFVHSDSFEPFSWQKDSIIAPIDG